MSCLKGAWIGRFALPHIPGSGQDRGIPGRTSPPPPPAPHPPTPECAQLPKLQNHFGTSEWFPALTCGSETGSPCTLAEDLLSLHPTSRLWRKEGAAGLQTKESGSVRRPLASSESPLLRVLVASPSQARAFPTCGGLHEEAGD